MLPSKRPVNANGHTRRWLPHRSNPDKTVESIYAVAMTRISESVLKGPVGADPVRHQLDHRDLDEGLDGRGKALEVLGEAAVAGDPGEGAPDDPPLCLDDEAGVGAPDDN